ncbi:hypothetical protein Tco_0461358 [Tanacetum coccineum]
MSTALITLRGGFLCARVIAEKDTGKTNTALCLFSLCNLVLRDFDYSSISRIELNNALCSLMELERLVLVCGWVCWVDGGGGWGIGRMREENKRVEEGWCFCEDGVVKVFGEMGFISGGFMGMGCGIVIWFEDSVGWVRRLFSRHSMVIKDVERMVLGVVGDNDKRGERVIEESEEGRERCASGSKGMIIMRGGGGRFSSRKGEVVKDEIFSGVGG